MYFSKNQIVQSLNVIKNIHPFYGLTFLVCKKNNLPVGDSIYFPINFFEEEFLNTYFKPDQNTLGYFRPFRVSDKEQYWWRHDYPSSGSQSTRTRKFSEAFIHEKKTNLWGWSNKYIDVLHAELERGKLISLYDLAVWIYREYDWGNNARKLDVQTLFTRDFNLSLEELDKIFIVDDIHENINLVDEVTPWEDIRNAIGAPPPADSRPDQGGALRLVNIEGVGPSTDGVDVNFADRINVITGDNGLGKTFLLEIAWWVLSGNWATNTIYPDPDTIRKPKITFQIASSTNRIQTLISNFDWRSQKWQLVTPRQTMSGLLVYARVDGSFSVWDPARASGYDKQKEALNFTRNDVWNGLKVNNALSDRYVCNGLINDWVFWQTKHTKEPFVTLERVLQQLSPPEAGDLGVLKPGNPARVPNESRPMPTIKHSYGEVPLVFASEAVKRIVALAYLIVWAWNEHKAQAEIIREEPEERMVILVDEIEAHLHPQWQRLILPALNEALHGLSKKIKVQLIITTHSPLVLSSLEPIFNNDKDSIFHLNLKQNGKKPEVILETPNFVKYGSADSWLKSDFFDMRQPSSLEYENIIEKAKAFMKSGYTSKEEIRAISKTLAEVVPNHSNSSLIARWKMYADKYGVNV